jgi:hypothetical protein
MLIQSGLYYPYIHIRNDTWLKAAALYWKRVDRIVPGDYPTQDSRTVKLLQDHLDFIHGHRPGRAARQASELFIRFLRDTGPQVVRELQVQPARLDLRRQHEQPRDGGLSQKGTIGYIFAEKLTPQLIGALDRAGLAFGASADARHRRKSLNIGSANWIGMDSRLAAVYMTVLTRITADFFDLNPVTDIPRAHAAIEEPDVAAIAETLINESPLRNPGRASELKGRVATLAIESTLPRSLALVDTERIVAFRQRHEDELGAFQAAVSAAAEELASLPQDVDALVLKDRLAEVTHNHLLRPRDELEGSMKLFGFETVKSALTLQLPLSASAGAMLGAPYGPLVESAAGRVPRYWPMG